MLQHGAFRSSALSCSVLQRCGFHSSVWPPSGVARFLLLFTFIALSSRCCRLIKGGVSRLLSVGHIPNARPQGLLPPLVTLLILALQSPIRQMFEGFPLRISFSHKTVVLWV